MTTVLLLGTLFGLGLLGALRSVSRARPPLASVDARLRAPLGAPVRPLGTTGPGGPARPDTRVAAALTSLDATRWIGRFPAAVSQRGALEATVRITGRSIDQVVAQSVTWGALGLLVPAGLWVGAGVLGTALPLAGVAVASVGGACIGIVGPWWSVRRQAADRRRHAAAVVSTYVDLVVLGLAGGVGIDGALVAASEVSDDWTFVSIRRSLRLGRERGGSSWDSLASLGRDLGVPELIDVAASLQLAGTEGARIRRSLSARGESLRRHQQAEAEADAHAVTERLFLPGALLLIGFLLFIGYPAMSRILGGL